MKVITENSIWDIDEDAMIFSRFPKNGEGEAKKHPYLSYQRVGKPTPFISIERGFFHGADRIKINATDKSQCCYTGEILEVI